MTLDEFQKYHDRDATQRELYRRADLDVNGDPKYYELLGQQIERYPIHRPGMLACRTGIID